MSQPTAPITLVPATTPADSVAAIPAADVQVAALSPVTANVAAAHGPQHEGGYTVTVHAPVGKGMRAYLVGPGAHVVLDGFELNSATSRIEGGNLRITTANGSEILLLDFVAGAHSPQGVTVVTGQGALPGSMLLSALEHGSNHREQKMHSKNGDDCGAILVHHGHKLVLSHHTTTALHHAHHNHIANPCLPEMAPAEGPAPVEQGAGGFLVPTINGDVFGVAGPATVGVIAPFATGFTTDHIQYTQYLTFPNAPTPIAPPPPPFNNVIANPDSATIHCMPGNSVNIAVLANDVDPQGDAFSITSFTQPAFGTVTENANGTFTYTQTVAHLGADTYTYTITDAKGATSQTTVTVNITDNPPVANADVSVTAYQTPVTTTVLANDTDPDGDMIHVVSAGNGAHGTTVVNADGTITYTPAAGFSGTDTYQYTIADDCGLTSTTTVTVTIGAAPPPFNNVIANPDSATIHCMPGNSVNIAVLANDVDPQGDAFSITSFTQPAHGTVAENANGTFTYTQTGAFLGADTYTYTITDAKGATSTTTVTVNITDNPPVANADVSVTAYNTPVTTTVLANDTDPDGDMIHVVSATNGAHGTTVVNADGTITYTPAAGFSGTDTYMYTIADDCGLTSTTTVTVTTGAAPFNNVIANPDETTIHCMPGNAVNINVLANDVDPQGDAFSITGYTQPSHGTVSENTDGTFHYTQTDAFIGADTFTYTITDAKGATSETTVTVNITDNPPVAVADVCDTAYNTPVLINVLANDSDPDTAQFGDQIHIVSVGEGAHGTTQIVNGQVLYTPAFNFTGTDTFTYTIADDCGLTSTTTVTVTIGAAPFNNVIANPDQATIHCMPGYSTDINVLANDTDPQGDAFSITGYTQPSHGTVTENTDGTFHYTQTGAFLGADTFSYTITDAQGATSTTTVTVNITDNPPVANADATNTAFNTPVVTTVLANDTDPDGDMIHVVSATNGAHGSTTVNADGTITYTPATGFSGTDTYQYTIADDCGLTSTTTVTVTTGAAPFNNVIANPDQATIHCMPGNSVVINEFLNDYDPQGDAFALTSFTQPAHGTVSENADGTFTYTQTAAYLGVDTFDYTITDSKGATATTTVAVNITDNPPVANADVCATGYNNPVLINVLANDTDPDGDAIHLVSAGNGAHGTTQIVNGQVLYIPAYNFSGTDTFQYTIADDCGLTSTTTVTVTVGAAPFNNVIANPDQATIHCMPGNAVDINVLANDTDPQSDAFSITSFSQPAHGTVSENADGTFHYTQTDAFIGLDTFTYTITDSKGATSQTTVSVNITDAPPVANADATSTAYNTPVVTAVLANDTDPDGDMLHIVSATNGAHGSTTVNADGTITYTPATGFSGTDTYQYTIADDCGLTSTTTVTVTTGAAPFNNVIANPDETTVHCMPGSSVVINEFLNDYDPQGDAFSATSFTQPAFGNVTQNADGTFTYTQTVAHLGDDVFNYTITDSKGATATTTVTVHITDNPPVANADVCDTGYNTPVLINVLANDTDPDGDAIHLVSAGNGAHGTTQIVNGQVLYVPAYNFTGTDTFQYTIADDCGLTSTTTVTVTVGAAPPPPPVDTLTANPDNATVHCGSAVAINVVANDTDSLNNAFSVTAFTQPAHGTVTEGANGIFTYQSNGMYLGADAFTYMITDSQGVTSSTTVTINVTDTAPIAHADSATTAYQTPVAITILANDTDPDGDPIHVVSNTNGAHGTVTVDGNGVAHYTPAAGFTGTDTFTYTIADNCGLTSTTTVTVGVGAAPVVVPPAPVNHPPVANPDVCGVKYGNVVQLPNLLANDTDPDGDAIHLVSLNNGSTSTPHGIIFQDSNGNYYYQPLQNGTYDDVISYTIADSHGATATSTLDIHVTAGSYSFTSAGGTCPLVIDLGGDGISLLSGTESHASFDLSGSGVATHTAWVGANEGILAIDRNGNGTIDGINEVFGSSTTDGFTELAKLEDSNHDGIIDAKDADWNNLRVWVDANGDGISQPGELHTLSGLGIESIDVSHVTNTGTSAGTTLGNGTDASITALGIVHLTDGSILTAGSVVFNNAADAPASSTATTTTTDTSHTAATTTGSSLSDLVAAPAAMPTPQASTDHTVVAAPTSADTAASTMAHTDASSIVMASYTLPEQHITHVVA